MSVWFENNPQLLQDEFESLDRHGIHYKKKEDDSGLFKLVIECHVPPGLFGNDTGDVLVLIVIYPDNFPYFRPEVRAPSLDFPRHQNPLGKNLCLLGRTSDYWNVQTIGDYLNERLPLIFDQGKITDPEIIKNIPDEQAEPVSAYYISRERIAVISGRPEILNEKVPKPTKELEILNSGKLVLGLNSNFNQCDIFDEKGQSLTFQIHEWQKGNGETIPNDFDGKISIFKKKPSSWYLLSRFPKQNFIANFYYELSSLIERSGSTSLKPQNISSKNCNHIESCCLMFPEEQEPGVYKWGWIFVTFSTTSNVQKRKEIHFQRKFATISKVQSLSASDLSQRIPQSRGLSKRTIGIIGAGAIGAPTVLEFARNGCYKIKVMDHDDVEVTNTVRWPLGQEYVGWQKVNALADYINKNYPSVKTEPFNHWMGNPHNGVKDENELIEKFLSNCDIIVDASVEQGVNHLISVRCRIKGIPYILLEGRRGGWGGLVARILPETEKGCWMCLQNKLYLKEEKEKIPTPPEDFSGTIQERGCGDVTFTGANYDMTNISLAAVKLTANTLSSDEDFNWDVAVLSTIKEDEKRDLPSWKKYSLPVSENCCYKDDFHR